MTLACCRPLSAPPFLGFSFVWPQTTNHTHSVSSPYICIITFICSGHCEGGREGALKKVMVRKLYSPCYWQVMINWYWHEQAESGDKEEKWQRHPNDPNACLANNGKVKSPQRDKIINCWVSEQELFISFQRGKVELGSWSSPLSFLNNRGHFLFGRNFCK